MANLKDVPCKCTPWVRKVAQRVGIMLLDRLETGETGTIAYSKGAELVRRKSGGEVRVLPCRMHRSLGLLQELCRALDLPCLPSLVVGKKTGIPGKGFYKAYTELDQQNQVEYPAVLESEEQMRRIAETEQEACRKHEDWQELRNALNKL